MKENNILLANFLGWKGVDNGYDTRELIDEDIYNWGAIMAVVEKIETLLPDDNVVTIEYKDCIIPVGEFTIKTNGSTKIEAVYNACVEFVEWWNKNN